MAENGAIRVVLVDDHEIVRRGIRAMLATETGIILVGEAASAEEALQVIPNTKPHVVLVDIKLTGAEQDGLNLGRVIKERFPGTRVIAFTGYDSQLYLSKAVELGLDGFLLKERPRSVIASAIGLVAAGVSTWETDLFRRYAGYAAKGPSLSAGHDNPGTERLIISSLAKGLSNKQIARDLGCSEASVKKYIHDLMAKVGVSNRTRLVVWLHQHHDLKLP